MYCFKFWLKNKHSKLLFFLQKMKIKSRKRFNIMKDFEIRSILPTIAFSRYQIPKATYGFQWMEVYGALVASLSFLCSGAVQSYTSPFIYGLEGDGESNITLTRSDILWIGIFKLLILHYSFLTFTLVWSFQSILGRICGNIIGSTSAWILWKTKITHC